MLRIYTYLFWIVFSCASILGYNYWKSRNKHLFFKTGSTRSLLWVFFILVLSPVAVNYWFPDMTVDLKADTIIHLDEVQQRNLLRDGEIGEYYKNIVSVIWHNMNWVGFVSALLIMVTWFIYIHRMDVFHKEKLRYQIGTLLLGMICSLLVAVITDGIDLYHPITYTGHFWYDLFVFSFLDIGVIEEFVKLIPFFIILKFTKEIDEPYDYILYACLSALGFAFIENLIYFKNITGTIIQGRAMLSVVGHMLESSFAVYGLVISRYQHSSSKIVYFGVSFLIASFLHGLYDYLLFEHMLLLVIGIFIFEIQAWTIMVNNTINNSQFFHFKTAHRDEKLRFFLAVMLSGILVLNYFVDAFQYGKQDANTNYLQSCLYSGLLIIFYVTHLSNYDLVKGYWRPIEFRISPPDYDHVPVNRGLASLLSVFKYNFIQPVNIVNYIVTIQPPHYNQLVYGYMSLNKGKIVDRICLLSVSDNGKESIDPDWFVVKLRDDLDLEDCLDDQHVHSFLLIKLETKSDSLIHDEDIRVFMRLIPDMQMVRSKQPIRKDAFPPIGYGLVNSVFVPGYTVKAS
ncbi:PrsW family intramembrane metalloprotease [Cytophagaceae bacterium DM2B3-1]|uniref:PrsW family intramembrane metalloprotease n=1 Tax=Xanthocytophaga flava TaxID=3048013 RepID=A0ABT7CT61_9BACT|nr:PrsW family intramembrane metalloprotease [Xanthocytophaga flavus]MDJ1496951.1 PrsW family intramembrane metalloprotease [Xanthocytophaga flavus]